ncbi:molecular chaperone GrpE (heat shock protein) [Candidatus Nitrososphaera evergladensis SR1]|uniref:Protein GrpE n=1 Tax=Candidatus Nitrososphaera evergladensis SR1 TaxID=1459636 RepID=A0A075MU42_9ARCH|nr:nucleotide exchange factor GrpE [Candidatus Nitrososphaera evergladensis]AIF85181.1 molecular chaperone GrpE (heat shock protein) [Candidatus Nitrososphaera evergladensis SR1]
MVAEEEAAAEEKVNAGKEREEAEEEEMQQQIDEIEKLRKELAAAKEAAEGYLNKLKYLMADFDNYRKQMEKHAASRVETIKAELLLKFLNIRDDYQRAVESARQKKSEPAVIEGLEGILKNIDSLLSSEGVMPIEAVGTPFDPSVHDAIAFSPREDAKENTVTAEIRRGYMLNGKVLRPSMVEIARKIVKNSDVANNGGAGEE